MSSTLTKQQADGHSEAILAEQAAAEARVVREGAPDPARVVVPAVSYGHRIGTVADLAGVTTGARVSLWDGEAQRIHYSTVRSFTGEHVNIDASIRLSIVDDQLEPLGDGMPVTDGRRYWLIVPAGEPTECWGCGGAAKDGRLCVRCYVENKL